MKLEITPPHTSGCKSVRYGGQTRNSNLELFRVLTMLLIVMHHYVVNSGLIGVLRESPIGEASAAMMIFGAWGKTGINCFVLITGWFMCRSRITSRKFLKLYLQLAFYGVVCYAVFCAVGRLEFSPVSLLKMCWPVWSIDVGFTSCFMVFYLLIPFLNVLINNISRRQLLALTVLLVGVYTVMPTLCRPVSYNYVSWFCVLYLVAASLRAWSPDLHISHRRWGALTLLAIAAGVASILIIQWFRATGRTGADAYFFVSDSNKLLALLIAVGAFMWFKELRLPQSRLINAAGAATFGVLLIHANSDTMRQWLWRETVDCTGHFSPAAPWATVGYAIACCLAIFCICAIIDHLRARVVEPALMRGVDRVLSHPVIKRYIPAL